MTHANNYPFAPWVCVGVTYSLFPREQHPAEGMNK
jgi:hypothetical protein